MNALLLLGCPELPIQTCIALYLSNKLKKEGIDVTIAGNSSALAQISISDPNKHYINRLTDIDRCIAELAEKKTDFDLCFVFVRNDAGVSYLATVNSLSQAKKYAIIYGSDIEPLIESCKDMGEIIADKAVHNPVRLKMKIDAVKKWG